MRKVFVCFLILMLPVLALADIDWSSMTVEEIQNTIDSGRAEILTREIKTDEKGTVILDADGIVVSVSSVTVETSYDGSTYLNMKYTVANNSTENMGFSSDKVYLNGWEVSSFLFSSLDAGKKSREESAVYHIDDSADVTSYEDLEELEITCYTFNADNYQQKTKDIKTTLYFNK